MNRATKVFLVLLRLAIGWHFLFEGYEKIHSVNLGPTETNRVWTSEPYLRESSGPFRSFFVEQAGGDLDQRALDRLAVPAGGGLPPALERDWNDYYQRFLVFYTRPPKPLTESDLPRDEVEGKDGKQIREQLDALNKARKEEWDGKADGKAAGLKDEVEKVRQLADAKFAQAKKQTELWFQTGTKKVQKSYPGGTSAEVELKTPERIEAYRKKAEEVRTLIPKELSALGKDVEGQKLRAAKAELARMRTELMNDLNDQTAKMKKALDEAVYDLGDRGTRYSKLYEAKVSRPIERVDFVTRWGLFLVGLFLILGLFSRTACVVGAAFLLMFYLSMPPFPWLPENPRAEGHYLFVNKNLIEMLALLTLATTHSGRWAGLDGLLHLLNPWRLRAARRNAVAYNRPLDQPVSR